MATLRVMGIMSGTSMDAVDVAIADLSSASGVLWLSPVGDEEVDLPSGLRDRLLAALPPGHVGAGELCALDTELGRAFAGAATRCRDAIGGGHVDLVSSLGQTLFHRVDRGRALGTLQLGQPAWIAEATGAPVVSDFRTRDVAAGGQGAPLVALLDTLWLGASGTPPTAAVNIGGIANITVVGLDRPLAYDTGPGNSLLDCAASMVTGGEKDRDTDGALAAAGEIRTELLDSLLADPYLAAPPPKSTGKEHFGREFLRAQLDRHGTVEPADLLATLTEFTAATIGTACLEHGVRSVAVSGGGVRNPVLIRRLRDRLAPHGTTVSAGAPPAGGDEGLPPSAKEAYLAAVLGFLTWHGLPGNLAGATGARGARILGSITPGTDPLRLPEPVTTPPERLRITPARTTTGHANTDHRNQEETCESPTSS